MNALLIGFLRNEMGRGSLFLFFEKYRMRLCGLGDRKLRHCKGVQFLQICEDVLSGHWIMDIPFQLLLIESSKKMMKL